MASDSTGDSARGRLDAFVDGAFAFAVTLLLISDVQAPQSLGELQTALLRLPASAAAFILIAMFWSAHRAFGRMTPHRDGAVFYLSLAIVFAVLVYVFPLRLLTQSLFVWISAGRLPGIGLISSLEELQTLYITYGAGFSVLAGLYSLLFVIARRRAASPEARDEASRYLWPWSFSTAAGLLSILLAATVPLEHAPWLPPTAYWLIPVAIGVRAVLARRMTPDPEA